MNLAIETEDLGKRYGAVTAVDHLSLRVAEGEIYGAAGMIGTYLWWKVADQNR